METFIIEWCSVNLFDYEYFSKEIFHKNPIIKKTIVQYFDMVTVFVIDLEITMIIY